MKATQKKQVRESLELIEKAINSAYDAKGEINEILGELQDLYNHGSDKWKESGKGESTAEEIRWLESASIDVQLVLERLESTKTNLQAIKL